MLAKAVAHHTTAAFIRVVGSEFVQKYLGEVRRDVWGIPHAGRSCAYAMAATQRCGCPKSFASRDAARLTESCLRGSFEKGSIMCPAHNPADTLQGPRMVRDVFRLAKENEPAIIFIDEVDAIATARFDAQTGADRCLACSADSFCCLCAPTACFCGASAAWWALPTAFRACGRAAVNRRCNAAALQEFRTAAPNAPDNVQASDCRHSVTPGPLMRMQGGAAHLDGAAKPDGRLRPDHQCEGGHCFLHLLSLLFSAHRAHRTCGHRPLSLGASMTGAAATGTAARHPAAVALH